MSSVYHKYVFCSLFISKNESGFHLGKIIYCAILIQTERKG